MESLYSLLSNIASFVVIISVIVAIHELGHYSVAKLSGVKIEVFSIGFGKELLGWNDRSGTRWKVSLLPLGGYVKMYGDADPSSAPDDDALKEMTEEEKKGAFHFKSLPIKAAVVAAGPAANFVLAIVILTFFYSFYGKPVTLPEVSQIVPESAAQEAGLREGDMILSIDGQRVERFEDIQRAVSINLGAPLTMRIERGGVEAQLQVTPQIQEREDMFGNTVKVPMLGIMSQSISHQEMHAGNATVEAVRETWFIAGATLKAVGQIITGKRSTEELSGPLRIAKYSGQATDRGMATVLWFMVVLSVNLGLINLFPIPVLDGGHLLYYGIEALQGKPLAEKFQQWGFRVGLAMILCLAVFATFNDVRHLGGF